MPLVTIEDVAPDDPAVIDAALAGVADAVSRALGRAPVDVWARFVTTGRTRFGASGARHPIVTVATGEQSSHVRERVLRAAAAALADAVGVPADAVWARFDVLEPGTVLADGEMQ